MENTNFYMIYFPFWETFLDFSLYFSKCSLAYACVCLCQLDVRAWMSAQKWQRQRAKAKSQEQKQLIEWVASDTREATAPSAASGVQRKINRFAIAL